MTHTPIDINEYIARLEAHVKAKLTALEQAVAKEFKCQVFWDPIDQAYRFPNSHGRKREHYTRP